MQSFLTNRRFIVDINETKSSTRLISAGVPQGSPLSPLLFALFIKKIGEKLSKQKIHYALYADDLVIWKIHSRIDHIKKSLQDSALLVYKFFNKLGLKINEKKCQISTFTNKRSNFELDVALNGQKITYEPHPIILGIKFDRKLNFNEHFNDIIKKTKFKNQPDKNSKQKNEWS